MGTWSSCLLRQASVQGMVSQLILMPATELQIFTRVHRAVDRLTITCHCVEECRWRRRKRGRGIDVHVHWFPAFFASLGKLICHCLKLTVRLVIQFCHGTNCYCLLFVSALVFDADVHSISFPANRHSPVSSPQQYPN